MAEDVNSSLVFSVKTDEALRNITALSKQLEKLKAQLRETGTTQASVATQATKNAAAEIKAVEEAATKAKAEVGKFTSTVGVTLADGVRVGTRVAAEDLQKLVQKAREAKRNIEESLKGTQTKTDAQAAARQIELQQKQEYALYNLRGKLRESEWKKAETQKLREQQQEYELYKLKSKQSEQYWREELLRQNRFDQQVRSIVTSRTINPTRNQKYYDSFGSSLKMSDQRYRTEIFSKAEQMSFTNSAEGLRAYIEAKRYDEVVNRKLADSLKNVNKETSAATIEKQKAKTAQQAAAEAARVEAEMQGRLHTALRGVSGVAGGLWLTYSRYTGVMVAAAGATASFMKTLRDSTEFDYQTRFVAALGDRETFTSDSFKQIQSDLVKYTKDSTANLNENARALRVMQQTGIDAAAGVKLLNVSLAASIMGETDMKTATEDLVSVLEVFNLHSENSDELAKNYRDAGDIIAFVSQETKANFHDVATSLQGVTGVAQEYGVKLEEVAALQIMLGKQGIVGSRAGTYARSAIESIYTDNSVKAGKVKDQLGFESFDKATGKAKDFTKALTEIVTKMRDFTPESQAQMISDLFPSWGAKSFRAVNQDLDEFLRLLKESTNQSGLLREQMDKVGESTQIKWDKLKATFDNAFILSLEHSEGLRSTLDQLKDTISSKDFQDSIGSLATSMASALHNAAQWTILMGKVAGFGKNMASPEDSGVGRKIFSGLFPTLGGAYNFWDNTKAPEPVGPEASGRIIRRMNLQAVKDTDVLGFTKLKEEKPKTGTRTYSSGSDKEREKAERELEKQFRAELRAMQKAGEDKFRLEADQLDHTRKVYDQKVRFGSMSQEAANAMLAEETRVSTAKQALALREEMLAAGTYERQLASRGKLTEARKTEIEALKDHLQERITLLEQNNRNELVLRQEAAKEQLEQIKREALNSAKEMRNSAQIARDRSQQEFDDTLSSDAVGLAGRAAYRTQFQSDQSAVDKAREQNTNAKTVYDQMKSNGASTSQLEAQKLVVEATSEAFRELTAQQEANADAAERLAREQEEASRTFEYGWKKAMAEYEISVTDHSQNARSIFQVATSSMEDTFINFAKTGELSFRGMATAIIEEMLRIQARAATLKLAKLIMGEGVESGTFGGGSMGGGVFSLDGLIGNLPMGSAGTGDGLLGALSQGWNWVSSFFAKGGVFTNQPTMFADGGAFGSGRILTETTPFMFGNRQSPSLGFAGEAGPEAALPLKRMSSGELGVYADIGGWGQGGGGGNTTIQNIIQVTVQGGDSPEKTGEIVSQEVLKVMERVADKRIMTATRNGGILNKALA